MHALTHWPPNFLWTESLTPQLIHVLGFLPLHGHSLLKDGRNSSSHTLRAGAALKEWVQPIVPATACLWVAQLCAAETSKHTWIYHVNPSGYYRYHQFNIHNSPFRPHSVFMCFEWISEQTAIISLYNFNWLVCITETECVYCAVRTGSLNVIQVKLSL